MYKGIIFDLDGTLLNTIEDITDSINYALEKNRFPIYQIDEVKYFVGSGVDALITRATKITDVSDHTFKAVKNDYNYKYAQLQKNKTAPYQKIISTLEQIKKLGLAIGVVSNKPQIDTERVIEYYFDKQIFTKIYGKREGFLPKPDPKTVLEMVDIFNLHQSEVLYVGDSDIDMKTAINAQLDAVAVLWGFRKRSELAIYNPKYMIEDPEELVSIITNN